MGRRAIIAYLDHRWLSARAVHNDIVATLAPNIVGYSAVTRYLREADFPLSTEEASDADDRNPINHADESILPALNESLFRFARQLSRPTYVSPMTVDSRLTQSLGFTARHLRSVPHAL
jgi:hypothetical protein